jgi:ribosomal protein L31E
MESQSHFRKMTVTLRADQHKRLTADAKAEDRSAGSLIRQILARHFAQQGR